eukprot:CAMPEP_0178907420 /NCGR_PEP_ID=MMETSP0786-20121207/7362_1 /TAXON_ID=186022 /ORGANISM="Thalassionema frauenfeldii, Strain CCMP 1798" /LENGTH=304 /DNA_ID=CAMNT_0020579219 /DNA_START=72 /DNA_END=986 /DNA_ORIENTATION=-
MSENTEKTQQVLALYRFISPAIPESELKLLKEELQSFCLTCQVRGTLILAGEGINGTICYPCPGEDKHDAVLEKLESLFPGIKTRSSKSNAVIFTRLSIKIKKEIVTLGDPNIDPTAIVGTYVKPGVEWDNLLRDPDCLVIDTRNDYEVRLGSFENAVNPHTESFKDFPEWLSKKSSATSAKKIAMFCTGGIRCEKATSMVKSLYPDKPVFHLEGGILAYLDNVHQDHSTFRGECYVFDKRVAVGHGLIPSEDYVACFACRQPLSQKELQGSDYVKGLSCRYCAKNKSEKQQKRFMDRNKQVDL